VVYTSIYFLKGPDRNMKRTIPQIFILLLLACFCVSGYLVVRHFLQLPFRSTNDDLHQKNSSLNLDFFIPAGTHIDEKMTIGEVMKTYVNREATSCERIAKSLSDLIPQRYLYLADLVQFLFWSFLFMVFLRVFTFMGYGRALRTSLFLGACTYYFMPDFSPGKMDDVLFISIAFLIIFLRASMKRRTRKIRI
jgi:hypothetical protein